MTDRMKPLLGGMFTAIIVNYLGVYYLYGPVAASAEPGGLDLPRGVAVTLAAVIFVLFLDWVNQTIGNPVKTAIILALSQILLVDVYYVLAGQRGMTQAAVSAVVLLAGWVAAGFVYGKLMGGGSEGAA